MASSLALFGRIQRLRRLRQNLLAERLELALETVPPAPPTQATEPPSTDDRPRESVLDLQQRLSPRLKRAEHFRLYAERFEHAIGGDLRVLFSAPPQHGKTQVTLAALIWTVLHFPGRRHAYITYSQTRARRMARLTRRLLALAGVLVTGTLDTLILPDGGQLLFTSIDGGITGEPVDGVAVIDDPYKNEREAKSKARREVVDGAYRSAIETRVHPGASIFVLATRWHPKDLTGTLQAEGWEYLNLPAICENDDDPNGRQIGEALFPEVWSVDSLLKKQRKVLAGTWAALYQGRPRAEGSEVFHSATYYTELPKRSYRVARGVDLAYTASTSSDYSVHLELWCEDRYDAKGENNPLYFVVHVDRKQVDAPSFTLTLKARTAERRAPMRWYYAGPEKGSADFIKRRGVPLRAVAATTDKLVRATPVAAAWNEGRVLVPDRDACPHCEALEDACPKHEWVDAFVEEVEAFTGLGGEQDDQVDALAAAFDELDRGSTDDLEVIEVKR